jgi:hypothetical protein
MTESRGEHELLISRWPRDRKLEHVPQYGHHPSSAMLAMGNFPEMRIVEDVAQLLELVGVEPSGEDSGVHRFRAFLYPFLKPEPSGLRDQGAAIVPISILDLQEMNSE